MIDSNSQSVILKVLSICQTIFLLWVRAIEEYYSRLYSTILCILYVKILYECRAVNLQPLNVLFMIDRNNR